MESTANVTFVDIWGISSDRQIKRIWSHNGYIILNVFESSYDSNAFCDMEYCVSYTVCLHPVSSTLQMMSRFDFNV